MPPISEGTVSKIEKYLRDSDHVKYLSKRHQYFIDEDAKIIHCWRSAQENPSASEIVPNNNVSHTVIPKLFKSNKEKNMSHRIELDSYVFVGIL